jgi:hypothetical protein
MEAIRSYETSVLTRAKSRQLPEYGFFFGSNNSFESVGTGFWIIRYYLRYLLLAPAVYWNCTAMTIASRARRSSSKLRHSVRFWSLVNVCGSWKALAGTGHSLLTSAYRPQYHALVNPSPSNKWGMVSSGLLRRVALVRTDVSEEPGASFIRVTKIGELGTRNNTS